MNLRSSSENVIDTFDYLILKNNLYYNSIIVISNENNLIFNIINNPFVYSYIAKNSKMEYILETINSFVLLKEAETENFIKRNRKKLIKQKINKELAIIGYNSKYIGTKYLSDAIYLQYFMSNKKIVKLKNDIYPLISKKYNIPINTIKCDIIKTTNKVKNNVSKEHIEQYFGFYLDKSMSPKLVINTIINKIK